MVRKKVRRKKFSASEEDPMTGTSNLVDVMLVLAVGFLIFVVLSWNMQSIVFSDMTTEEKQEVMKTINNVSQVNQGQQLNETPDVNESSGEGFTEMGKVYKDPSTGKLIMIEN